MSHGIKNSKIREGGQESKMRVYIGDMRLGESRQTQVNSCPEFLRQVGYVECRNEKVKYSLGREGFGSHIP